MNTESVRESLILSFHTTADRSRSMNIPDPVDNLNVMAITTAAQDLIFADIFDVSHDSAGALAALQGAVLQRVLTTVWF